MNHVDTTNWKRKKHLVQMALQNSIGREVILAAQDVYQKTNENLSGPGIKPGIPGSDNPDIGKMPVPRRTGNLAESLTMQLLSISLAAVYTDTRKAKYDHWVHDGTTKMQPRRYLGDVVSANGQRIFNKFDKEIKSEIHKVGR